MNSSGNMQLVERRTYVQGLLKGQYTGVRDAGKSTSPNESFYDLVLVRGELFIREEDITKWQTLNEEDFVRHDALALEVPPSILCHVNGEAGITSYWMHVQGIRIRSFQLLNRRIEGHKVFGDVHAYICAYVTHEDEVPVEDVPVIPDNVVVMDDPVGVRKFSFPKRKMNRVSAIPKPLRSIRRRNYWGCLPYVIGGLLLLPFLFFGFKFFWPFLLIGLVLWLLARFISFAAGRASFFWSFLGLLLALFFLSQVLTWLRGSLLPVPSRDDGSFVKVDETNRVEEGGLKTEFLVSGKYQMHHLVWNDYSDQSYEGDVYVRTRDWMETKKFRNSMALLPSSPEAAYDQMLYELYLFNEGQLDGLYAMFDSIQSTHRPGRAHFAEIIVSSIQHIPYTLIMDSSCNADDYTDQPSIYGYLSQEGRCVDQVKYGIYGPVEFIASLYGDCDTRTLLLFSVLKHYRYDVAILSSQALGHSILGIDLPYKGPSKPFRGKNYVFWETTARGMPPGDFPAHASNPDYWHVSLI